MLFRSVSQSRYPAVESCQTGYIACDAASSAKANVLATSNGATWAATAADPFANDEHIASVRCVEISRDSTRVMVFRGVTDGSNPAELAYSDDGGASWTNVNIGATNGEFVTFGNAVEAFDLNNIWVVTSEGYIYKSEDAGLTWSAQESGVITSDALNCVHFADKNVGIVGGDNNILMKTIDGGETWSQVSMPAGQSTDEIYAVFALDSQRFWVGYSDGNLYCTFDGGTTWNTRSFTGSGSGAIKSIKFINELQGVLVHNTSAPVGGVHMTFNGGYSWEKLTAFSNSGLNDIAICDDLKMFVVGETNSSTSYVAKGTAS